MVDCVCFRGAYPAVVLGIDHPDVAVGRTTYGIWTTVDAHCLLYLQHICSKYSHKVSSQGIISSQQCMLSIHRQWCNTSSPLSKVLDHQMAADVKADFLSNFLYILIIFK